MPDRGCGGARCPSLIGALLVGASLLAALFSGSLSGTSSRAPAEATTVREATVTRRSGSAELGASNVSRLGPPPPLRVPDDDDGAGRAAEATGSSTPTASTHPTSTSTASGPPSPTASGPPSPTASTSVKPVPSASAPRPGLWPPADFFRGAWRAEPVVPPYPNDCKLVEYPLDCTPEVGQRYAWSWYPKHATTPLKPSGLGLLDALRKLNISTLAFVGDSMQRNMFSAAACELSEVWPITDAVLPQRQGAFASATYGSPDALKVVYHKSWYLFKMCPQDVEDAKQACSIDTDVPDTRWFDSLGPQTLSVLSLGNWYDAPPSTSGPHLDFTFFTGSQAGQQDGAALFKHALKLTLAALRDRKARGLSNGVLVWRTLWRAHNSLPAPGVFPLTPLSEEQAAGYHDKENSAAFNTAALEALAEFADVGVLLLDTYPMTLPRVDGHIWRRAPPGGDRWHWCLPGVPDWWVTLLASVLEAEVESRAAAAA